MGLKVHGVESRILEESVANGPMQMHTKLEALIEEMLDGQILLDEAVAEFERLYIEKALARHKKHLSNTAKVLGIHRNTLSKRVTAYHKNAGSLTRTAKRSSR